MKDVYLAAGTVVSCEFDPVGDADTFTPIAGILSLGATGETSEPKDKTALADVVKKYGAAIQDTPDKSIKGQHRSTDASVISLITAAKARKALRFKVEFPDGPAGNQSIVDGTKATMTIQLLGFTLDEGTNEDWQMYTIAGKQSGATVWVDAVAAP